MNVPADEAGVGGAFHAPGPPSIWNAKPERWLDEHSGLLSAALVFAGFLLRLWQASGTFLNPDEAMHVLAASQPNLAAAYWASLRLAHPPLLILLLNLWRHLGTSELMLRLPSVIAGTAFCWIFFRWLALTLGRATAWTGLCLACFLPPMIELSAEVRQYALLLCFVVLAIYWLELSLRENSVARMFLSAASLYLAMLSHFSAILFAGALGGYGLLRLIARRHPKTLIAAWTISQAGALALLGFLYKTHISRLRGSEVERQVMRTMLPTSYFHWGQGHWLGFVFARSFGIFQFTFGQLVVGDFAALLFLGGMALLLRRRNSEAESDARLLGIFLLLPFMINCGAALADLYPYGGTRHSSFLMLFALAGVSYGLAKLARGKALAAMTGTAVIVVLCAAFGHPHRPYMLREDQRRANMTEAVAFLQEHVASSDRILVDFQTNFPLRYYLCDGSVGPVDTLVPGFRAFTCGRRQVVAAGPQLQHWDKNTFPRQWQEMLRGFRLQPGGTVWVVQMGWDADLGRRLQALPEFRDLEVRSFGRNIELLHLTVPRER